ncbi:MAG: hypothetical protein GX639_19850 [Fibrobacter sp.]|nr:hypothetical protein [Fibrobacter sp.]
MPGPATKLGSLTAHGGSVIGPGCPTVLINNVPAIRVGADMHVCPMFTGYVPHVGMNNIGPGVPTVLIGGLPASTVGDNFLCAGPPAPVVMGTFNVLIGTGAGGGGGSGGGGSSTTMEGLKSGKIKPPKGTESLPLEIQSVMADCQPYMPPESFKRRVEQLVLDYGETDQTEPPEKITIADFVEILEAIESEEGYEAARFFASYLDFGTLTSMAMGFISGDDPNPENDPNIMPTRFMILYGADDAKLQQIDDHPDCADGEEHKMNVANLRMGLRLLGYAVEDGSVYDDYVYMAHLQYMARCAQNRANIDIESVQQNIKNEKSFLKIKLDINPNAPEARDDLYTLYSTDNLHSYKKTLSVIDDADKGNNTLELLYEDLDTSLKYTLEVDLGGSGELKKLFKNRPFGEW